ncbi:MAG: hypothetical protein WC455_14720 [Dehalococcoidia bacterium]
MPAGRPRKPGQVHIQPSIRRETWDRLERERAELGYSQGQMIDRWAEDRQADKRAAR